MGKALIGWAGNREALRQSQNKVTLEYPQFLTLETGRMPDSIGQDAFSEVK
jgi:hypothetical protein